MGSHQCQRPTCSGKHLLKGWMPSSTALMELSHSKTPCARFCPQPTVPPSPKPASPRQHCPVPRHLPLALPWPSHWPAPLCLAPWRAPPMLVMDRACSPGVVCTCFRCGQAGHMVRECPLLDTHLQIPRPQVHTVESQGHSLEDYENE